MTTRHALAKCRECHGSGLYVGLSETNGAAVQCVRCKGTGSVVIKWEPFTKRVQRPGIVRVHRTNPGFRLDPTSGEDQGGVSYEKWQRGTSWPRGTEDREHTCPAWWYQMADYDKMPRWQQCDEGIGQTFVNCTLFAQRRACWQRYDDENKTGGNDT